MLDKALIKLNEEMDLLKKIKNNNGEGVIKSVFIAYFILVMHLSLIAGIGLLVLFFGGIITYMLWIFLGGSSIILGIGYLLYKRMKKEGRSLQDVLSLPEFSGRSVEVNLLGGLASIKVGKSEGLPAISYNPENEPKRISGQANLYVQDLSELARLFEKNLISQEEFQKAKDQLLFFALSEKTSKIK